MVNFFINRPIVAIVISIIIVIVGSFPSSASHRQYPEIVPPRSCSTRPCGADAQTVEQSVATPSSSR